ncbi:MAG: hypothetical protein L0Z70_12750 [Chloroflexi bacterium]|nr:hypothetical protein [Chloroflexota bacterium]
MDLRQGGFGDVPHGYFSFIGLGTAAPAMVSRAFFGSLAALRLGIDPFLCIRFDTCYDLSIGPCTGREDANHFDLEAHGQGDGFAEGGGVEGRVAGALYDLFDFRDDGYDSAGFGFDPIADIVFQGPAEEAFWGFWWNEWLLSGHDTHQSVRSVYQNAIDYNYWPSFDPLLPDLKALKSQPGRRALDLWDYVWDFESANDELTYRVTRVSDWRCGVDVVRDLGRDWILLSPQYGWAGSCEVDLEVTDSLEPVSDTFLVNIVPIEGRVFLPMILDWCGRQMK